MSKRIPLLMPLAIDLYCGLGGWTEGLLAEGYEVVGFDNERHVYGEQRYPAQLVLQDVLTLHGSQFRNAALIVASPPCQAYSYMAMPWSRAKRIAAERRENPGDLNALFDACFRIQREASEAAGHHIPLVVENVRGAQPWVGPAAWHYGSFYLWGDVPALMPSTLRAKINGTGSWFYAKDNTDAFCWRSNSHTPPGLRAESAEGVKQHGSGAAWFDKALDERRKEAGVKGLKVGSEERSVQHMSRARKAASAQIAKIPFELARWIGHVYR